MGAALALTEKDLNRADWERVLGYRGAVEVTPNTVTPSTLVDIYSDFEKALGSSKLNWSKGDLAHQVRKAVSDAEEPFKKLFIESEMPVVNFLGIMKIGLLKPISLAVLNDKLPKDERHVSSAYAESHAKPLYVEIHTSLSRLKKTYHAYAALDAGYRLQAMGEKADGGEINKLFSEMTVHASQAGIEFSNHVLWDHARTECVAELAPAHKIAVAALLRDNLIQKALTIPTMNRDALERIEDTFGKDYYSIEGTNGRFGAGRGSLTLTRPDAFQSIRMAVEHDATHANALTRSDLFYENKLSSPQVFQYLYRLTMN